MVLWLSTLGLGLAVGLARGGRLANLRHLWVRWLPLGMIGAAGVLAVAWAPLAAPEVLLAASLLLLVIFAFANLHLGGLGVLGVGLLANLVPVSLNAGMPVDPSVVVAAGLTSTETLELYAPGPARQLQDGHTVGAVLGQRIPIPELSLVVSFGDLVIAAGLAATAAGTVRRRRRGRIPVGEILAQLPSEEPPRPAARRERPVEVEPGRPYAIPLGWGPMHDDADDDPSRLELVGVRRLAGRAHPTMRLAQR